LNGKEKKEQKIYIEENERKDKKRWPKKEKTRRRNKMKWLDLQGRCFSLRYTICCKIIKRIRVTVRDCRKKD